MPESSDDTLRALIRLLPPAKALKEDLEKSIHLDLYSGTGDMAVRSFQGLQESVARLTNDPYVASLALNVAPGEGDREKVSVALLAAGQLAAYLEGQTGLVNIGGGRGGNLSIQTAPMMTHVSNVGQQTVERIFGKEQSGQGEEGAKS